MLRLTVTSRGRVTFGKDVLRHLGVRPGDKIELDLLPDCRIVIKAARTRSSIDGFIGRLAGRRKLVATIEELDDAAEAGWSGEK